MDDFRHLSYPLIRACLDGWMEGCHPSIHSSIHAQRSQCHVEVLPPSAGISMRDKRLDGARARMAGWLDAFIHPSRRGQMEILHRCALRVSVPIQSEL